MDKKYQNTYRIPSARLSSWNYGWQGAYFVTICTTGRKHYFGEIEDLKMILSDAGKIAEDEWIRTPSIRPDQNITLDAFCVMPNHFHAIIIIGVNEFNNRTDAMHYRHYRRDALQSVPTTSSTTMAPAGNHPGVQSKNLASIVRGYKSAVTKQVRIVTNSFGWQSRFHDHIIRDDDEFIRIRQYIIDNPLNWKNDKFYGAHA